MDVEIWKGVWSPFQAAIQTDKIPSPQYSTVRPMKRLLIHTGSSILITKEGITPNTLEHWHFSFLGFLLEFPMLFNSELFSL